MEYVTLNTGEKMPMLGLGVFRVESDGDGVGTMLYAMQEAGYRSIDTASAYDNETIVGEAVRKSGIDRSELFITTKLSNPEQREGNVEAAFEQSLKNLGMDYVDLYLIHWPVPEAFVDSWLAMEKIYKSGRARAIGVSNFNAHHIDKLKKVWSVVPTLNQVEMHPLLTQKALVQKCKDEGIAPQSWSPLGGSKDLDFKGNLLANEVLVKIAEKYGKSTAQVILRWNIELGIVTIPKSVTPARIKSNIDLFDFSLTADEVALIDGLDAGHRTGPDPDTFHGTF
ncbi:MAG: aldo/keto reductase [Defluviitaleaceae bacterium]|nr:aldo/keto reductase [Defluviitaleaceae bacterium]